MAQIELNTKQFKELITTIINNANDVLGKSRGYDLTFNDDGTTAYITPADNFPFYATYIEKFVAVRELYNCDIWFDIKNNKPCLVFISDN